MLASGAAAVEAAVTVVAAASAGLLLLVGAAAAPAAAVPPVVRHPRPCQQHDRHDGESLRVRRRPVATRLRLRGGLGCHLRRHHRLWCVLRLWSRCSVAAATCSPARWCPSAHGTYRRRPMPAAHPPGAVVAVAMRAAAAAAMTAVAALPAWAAWAAAAAAARQWRSQRRLSLPVAPLPVSLLQHVVMPRQHDQLHWRQRWQDLAVP